MFSRDNMLANWKVDFHYPKAEGEKFDARRHKNAFEYAEHLWRWCKNTVVVPDPVSPYHVS